jgi:hypothetical protein
MAGSSNKGNKNSGKKMSPSEAGKLGGEAYHEKRGAHGSDDSNQKNKND